MAKTIRLDERYSVIVASQTLLFDNRAKRSVPIETEVGQTLAHLAELGRKLAGLGATMTMTFTLPGASEEIRLDFVPAAEELELDEDE